MVNLNPANNMINLPEIPVEEVRESPVGNSLVDKEALAFERQKYDIESGMKVDEHQQKIGLRGIVAYWVLGLVSVWMAFLMVLIGCQAANCAHLTDAVILGLIGGTTVNIIGVCIWVVRSLFPSNDTAA